MFAIRDKLGSMRAALEVLLSLASLASLVADLNDITLISQTNRGYRPLEYII